MQPHAVAQRKLFSEAMSVQAKIHRRSVQEMHGNSTRHWFHPTKSTLSITSYSKKFFQEHFFEFCHHFASKPWLREKGLFDWPARIWGLDSNMQMHLDAPTRLMHDNAPTQVCPVTTQGAFAPMRIWLSSRASCIRSSTPRKNGQERVNNSTVSTVTVCMLHLETC